MIHEFIKNTPTRYLNVKHVFKHSNYLLFMQSNTVQMHSVTSNFQHTEKPHVCICTQIYVQMHRDFW